MSSFRAAFVGDYIPLRTPGAASLRRVGAARERAAAERRRALAAMRDNFADGAPGARVEVVERAAPPRARPASPPRAVDASFDAPDAPPQRALVRYNGAHGDGGSGDASSSSSSLSGDASSGAQRYADRFVGGSLDDSERSMAAPARAPSAPHTPDDGSRGGAVARAGDEFDKCPLCSRQAEYLVRAHRASATTNPTERGRSAAVARAESSYLRLFQLEQTLAIDEPDELVFRAVHEAYRVLIERYYVRYGVAYRPWTLADIRTHFVEHRLDELREARAHEARATAMEKRAYDSVTTLDPVTGAERYDPKMADTFFRAQRSTRDARAAVAKIVERRRREYEGAPVHLPQLLAELRALEASPLDDAPGADDLGGGSLSLGGM